MASLGTAGVVTLLRLTIPVMFIPSIKPFLLPFTRQCTAIVLLSFSNDEPILKTVASYSADGLFVIVK